MIKLLSRHHLRLERLNWVLNNQLGLVLARSHHVRKLFKLSLAAPLKLSCLTLLKTLLLMSLRAKLTNLRLPIFIHWNVHLFA